MSASTARNPGRAASGFEARILCDEAVFDPMRVMAVRHTLSDHPLLQLPALVELAQRLAPKGAVRYHNDRASAGTSFVHAPDTHRVEGRPEDILRDIESSRAWFALHNVQQDPTYRALVDEVLDSVRPMVERKDPGMSYRAGWIFVASPGAVTPYHMDHEHNFILQVRGHKTLHVWEPLDREVVTERSLELFHATGSRDLVVYQDEFEARAHAFALEPGMGGYMPTTGPHWVKNGEGVSITISLTYYTHAQRRRKRLHVLNHRLRSLGLTPSPVGASPGRDAAKLRAFDAYLGVKWGVKRLLGRPVEDLDAAYAH